MGGNPRVVLDMEFVSPEDAQLFKATLDKLVTFVGLLFQATGPDGDKEVMPADQARADTSNSQMLCSEKVD